jgi:glycosyltransferase involved in cell wall biosynthesis
MKVIQVSSFFHPSVGGVERQVEEIAVHLNELEDFTVEVYTTDATHGNDSRQESGRMLRLGETHRGVKVNRFRYQLPLGYFFRFSIGLTWKLLRADYDALHIHNIHDAHVLPAILIKIIRRKKLLITGHNPYTVTSEKRGGLLHWCVGLYEFVFRLFAFGVDKYIALLESEKQVVMRRFRWKDSKVVVVPNGIQEIYYAQTGDAERFYAEWNIRPEKWDLIVGAACRLNYVKGLQNLKQAADKLQNVLFVFVGGDAGYYENLKRIYRDNLNVVFTEQYIPANEMIDFYSAIDLFVLPSVYEPFGMTIVEAMAQGRPVLATNKGGPKEVLPEQVGDLLDPGDQLAWLRKLEYYTQHKAELREKGEKAKQVATKYQWDRVISSLVDLVFRSL